MGLAGQSLEGQSLRQRDLRIGPQAWDGVCVDTARVWGAVQVLALGQGLSVCLIGVMPIAVMRPPSQAPALSDLTSLPLGCLPLVESLP